MAEEEGVSCDILKLTRIFPIDKMVVEIAESYKKIIFFEEASDMGSISQQLGALLMENGYNGRYKRVTAREFIRQASMASQLEKLGLSTEAMLKTILEFAGEDRENAKA